MTTPEAVSLLAHRAFGDSRTQQAAAMLAWRAARMLEENGALQSGRILVLEPRSRGLPRALRAAGFAGRLDALACHALDDVTVAAAYDATLVHDWRQACAASEPLPVGDLFPDGAAYTLVIAADLAQVQPERDVGALLTWLSDGIAARGYALIGERSVALAAGAVEQTLRASGFLLARDVEHMALGDEPWTLLTFQKCGGEESRLTGELRRMTVADLEHHPVMLDGLIAAYREVFSGDDWKEWVRCPRVECGRQYSKRELAELVPPGQCLCGAADALVPFHSTESIVAKLHHELADAARSRCYVRPDAERGVAGFIWGYIDPAQRITALLTEEIGTEARTHLDQQMHELLATYGAPDAEGSVYYQSEIGVAEGARSLNLFRWMCRRVLEFADDAGVSIVVTRTSRLSSAYSLLLGIGMRVLLEYDGTYEPRGGDVPQVDGGAALTTDTRVVLGGSVREFLRVFAAESDRRLALRIARQMPRQRG